MQTQQGREEKCFILGNMLSWYLAAVTPTVGMPFLGISSCKYSVHLANRFFLMCELFHGIKMNAPVNKELTLAETWLACVPKPIQFIEVE